MKEISIICANENSTLETISLRGALEYFGYTTKVHFIGSTDQFVDLLQGKEKLAKTIVLSCHGCEDGFYGTDNKIIPIPTLKVHLPSATVLSLGCVTGTQKFAEVFLKGGVEQYIAPASYPEGNSSMMFALMFLWKLQISNNTETSFEEAIKILRDTEDLFTSYKKNTTGMLVNGTKEIPLE